MNRFAAPLLAAVLASALTAAAVPFLLGAPASPDAQRGAVATAPREAAAPAADEGLARRVDALAMRLSELDARLAALAAPREETARVAATTLDALERVAAGDPAARASDAPAQDVILDVIRRHEEEQQAAEEERRQEEREARALARADRIAEELGLATRDRDKVYGVLLGESERRRAAFERMDDAGYDPLARDTMRQEMDAVDAWRKEELARQLGVQLAEQVLELDDDRGGFRRGWGGGGRGDGGPGGGGRGDGGGR